MGQAPEHILVVDDELPILIVLSELLRRCGYEVTSVADGRAVLAQLEHRHFD